MTALLTILFCTLFLVNPFLDDAVLELAGDVLQLCVVADLEH
jgi:hypothetical protein